MRIDYDRGTLLLTAEPDQAAALPHVRWDPRVGRHRAPASAYAEIVAALRDVRFEDRARAPAPAPPPDLVLPELRPYQQAALDAWEAAGRRGIVVLPTGAGKTRLGAAAIARVSARTLVLAPTRVLVEQWLRTLAELGLGPLGQWGDGKHELAPITVATYEGALRAAPRLGACFELLVIDEVHHFGHGARDELLEMSIAPARIGLTATMSEDERARVRLEERVGPVVARSTTAELTGRWLAELQHVVLHLRLTRDEQHAYDAEKQTFHAVVDPILQARPGASWPEIVALARQTDAGVRALAALRAARRITTHAEAKRHALATLIERHRSERTLVFTEDNASAYDVARRHLIMPITCDIGRRERERAIAALREGHLRALVSARVLNEGVDVPAAEVAIIAGGALGAREHVQRVGRVLRPAPGKIAIVYELVVVGTSERRRAARRIAALGLSEERP
ncbi:DEAD/DEAH box helicase family protein [Sandaracinus amylolyticus]|uniref:DEAD/DEAH box helicase family protein n=1 Tax=Sandaracinus amylolyticus TaxID=927083 RepID=UPI001F340D5D|nr:DEAD/DEAH box helicase family protein [Sandaracinus amylolyticus]UJR79431.1 Type III restriction protein res subunit [Sandaracinus amylolyticus]